MRNKKRKISVLLLVVGVTFCAACGGEERADETGAVMEGAIEVAEDLPDRDVKVPDYLTEGDEQGSNEENSDLEEGIEEPVYHLSGEEQAEKARQVAAQIEDSINQVLADKEFYPNVTGISVNPECTEFMLCFQAENSVYMKMYYICRSALSVTDSSFIRGNRKTN